MTKKIVDKLIISLIVVVVCELGILFGINLAKNGFFWEKLSPALISGFPRAFVVTSGSMEPSLQTGSLVFSIPQKKYNINDTITFKQPDGKTTVTHRIVAVENQTFFTKGDANNDIDGSKINYSQIIGKAFIAFPSVGYLASSAKDPKIFILLVIVPATIIVYEELKFLKGEIFKKIKWVAAKFKDKNASGSNKLVAFVPALSLIFLFAGFSGSFFTNSDLSTGNRLTTIANFATATPNPTPNPTPTPGPIGIANHVVISEIQIKGDGTSSNDDEFVELYNPTSSDIVMSGWRLTRKNSSGTEATLVLSLNGTIPAYKHFLITDPDGYNGNVVGDAVYSAPSNSITNNYTVLLYSNAGIVLVDKVGFGSSPDPEGTAYSDNPPNNGSIERKAYSTSTSSSMTTGSDVTKGNGYDTNINSNDFITRTISDPQNTGNAAEIP